MTSSGLFDEKLVDVPSPNEIVKGNATTALTQTLGTLTINANSTLTSINNGANVSTTFTSLTRNPGGAINFVGQGANLGSTGNKIVFTTAPTQTNNIITIPVFQPLFYSIQQASQVKPIS